MSGQSDNLLDEINTKHSLIVKDSLSEFYNKRSKIAVKSSHSGVGGGTVGSDVTLRENWSVFIRCRTMPLGAALAL